MFGLPAHGSYSPRRRTVVAGAWLWLLCASAAADWQARVVDTDGRPVANAAVLLLNDEKALPDDFVRTIVQRNGAFVPRASIVTAGTAIDFGGRERPRHRACFFTAAGRPGAGFRSGRPGEPVVFDETGIVSMSCTSDACAHGIVYVVNTPYFALTDEQGLATIAGLPRGAFELHVWHPRRSDSPSRGTLLIDAAQSAPFTVSLALRPAESPSPPSAAAVASPE